MKNSESKLEKFTIFDGKCHVFQREGSPFYWCGFHHKGKFIRTSTKEKNKSTAEVRATDWYYEQQINIRKGVTPTSSKLTFGKVKDSALEYYEQLVKEGTRSQKTLDGITGILKSRVTPYFDKVLITEIDNTKYHEYKRYILDKYPTSSRGTLHQYKNAIRVVLNDAFRRGYIKQLPTFKDEYSSKRNPRPWFTPAEQTSLHRAIEGHANRLKKKNQKQYQDALELYDYVIFATNTGMRVGELNNVRFCDVRIAKEMTDDGSEKEILIISNIKGKRGTGTCKSYYGAVEPFKRLIARRNIKKPSSSDEKLFLIHHRVMFNVILEKIGLKYAGEHKTARRDFVSLRATYICYRLLSGVPVYDVAKNCRTSVDMIERSYGNYLSGQMMKNINKTSSLKGWNI